MTDNSQIPLARHLRAASAALARLEDENRTVRAELDLVLSSRPHRLLRMTGHPLWGLRGVATLVLGWKPLATARMLWNDLRFHRISLSSLAPVPATAATRPEAVRWARALRISGECHEGLLSQGDSTFTFRVSVGRNARLRAYCAVLPQAWDTGPAEHRFFVTVRNASGQEVHWERTASRVLNPLTSWRDRRWHVITVELPPAESGEVVVTLHSTGTPRVPNAPVAWGDLSLEWKRSGGDRRRLLQGAVRRFRWAGLRGMLEYAGGRQRLGDQSAVYAQWVQTRQLTDQSFAQLRAEVAALPYQPVISVITPVYNTGADVLTACLESVRGQAYERWQHCIADDSSSSPETRTVLKACTDDPRTQCVTLESRGHISAASNAAIGLATGEYVALLDHDDELAPQALAEIVRYLNAHPDADVVYSDEDKLDALGHRCEPYFKPDWSPELFLSYMYTCHLMVVRRRLLEEIGGFRTGFEGAQDYDLLLRLMDKTDRIHHIPQILYHWRKSTQSTAAQGTLKPWALDAGQRALEDYSSRNGLAARVLAGPRPGMYRFRRAIRGEPLVSIVVPTRGGSSDRTGSLLATCLRSLNKTSWRNVEVIVSTDGTLAGSAQEALRPLRHSVVAYEPRPTFNFSHKINQAVRHASGEHVVLFNDDLEVIDPEWLTAMLEYSQERSVGAVGAKLLYPDGRIQHVGMLIGVCGLAAHAFHQHRAESDGYFGSAITARNCTAVTAACLMTRRAVFDEVGGLDEELPVDFNDVDFCLRLRKAGYRIVFTPYAELLHHESASFGRRTQSSGELALMRQRWGDALEHDPYYNPNLSKDFSDYRVQL